MKRTQQNITFFSKKSKPTEEISQQTLDTVTAASSSSSSLSVIKEVQQQEAFSTTTAVEETVPPDMPTCTFPKIWTSDQWVQKKINYPWLDARGGKLGCRVCEKVSLAVYKNQGVSISVEWKNFQVSFYGDAIKAKLASLRKKINRHNASLSHNTAAKIYAKSHEKIFEKQVDSMNKEQVRTTEKVLRTAYFIAKKDRPFSDQPDLLELQELNGADVGFGLRSRFTATNMVDHISSEMRKTVCNEIQKAEEKISILIDESTTVSNTSSLIMYLKCLSEKNGKPHFMFLDLIELENQSAKAIFEGLVKCLDSYGFIDDYLKKHPTGFASDGASVMLGRKSGVVSQILGKYPNVIIWHCLNHRLELAVSDAIGEVTAVNHFQIFFDKLYSIYSRSPKNKHELESCALEVGAQLRKVGRIFDVQWLASSYRTVSAVWDNYQSLCLHFQKASNDPNKCNARSTFAGMLRRMQSPEFLIDLGIMYDALFELTKLSLLLQDRGTSIVYADKLIHRTIQLLETLKEKGGTNTLEARDTAKNFYIRTLY